MDEKVPHTESHKMANMTKVLSGRHMADVMYEVLRSASIGVYQSAAGREKYSTFERNVGYVDSTQPIGSRFIGEMTIGS